MAGGQPKPLTPTRRRMRKVGAVLAMVAGAALLVLERSDALGGERQGAAWFWIVIAALLILLGLAELLDRTSSAGG